MIDSEELIQKLVKEKTDSIKLVDLKGMLFLFVVFVLSDEMLPQTSRGPG